MCIFSFFAEQKRLRKWTKCLHHDANMNVVTLSASHCKCRLISFITCILASKYYNFSSNISFTASFFSAPRAKFCNFLLRLKAASVLCGWEETFTGRSKNSDTRRLCQCCIQVRDSRHRQPPDTTGPHWFHPNTDSILPLGFHCGCLLHPGIGPHSTALPCRVCDTRTRWRFRRNRPLSPWTNTNCSGRARRCPGPSWCPRSWVWSSTRPRWVQHRCTSDCSSAAAVSPLQKPWYAFIRVTLFIYLILGKYSFFLS